MITGIVHVLYHTDNMESQSSDFGNKRFCGKPGIKKSIISHNAVVKSSVDDLLASISILSTGFKQFLSLVDDTMAKSTGYVELPSDQAIDIYVKPFRKVCVQ